MTVAGRADVETWEIVFLSVAGALLFFGFILSLFWSGDDGYGDG
jgi:hypothetical protein